MGAAALLLPLLPGLIESIVKIVNSIRNDGQTTEEQRATLDAISANLDATVAQVRAVQFKDV